MPIHEQNSFAAHEFIATGNHQRHEFNTVNTNASSHNPSGGLVPSIRCGSFPDLDLVFEDLGKLNVPVNREQVALLLAEYIGQRDDIYQNGYGGVQGGEQMRGVPGLLNFCTSAVIFGVLALRDAQFIEATRVSHSYYRGDEEIETDADGVVIVDDLDDDSSN